MAADTPAHQPEFLLLQPSREEFQRRLIRGIIHKMNNSLTIFNGYTGLMKVSSEDPEITREALKQFERAGTTAVRILQQTEALTCPPRLGETPADVMPAVREVVDQVSQSLEVGSLRFNSVEPSCEITIDPKCVARVVSNLLANATSSCQAKGEGATALSVRCQNKQFLIEVEDQGEGMSEEILRDGVLPFVTSRKGEGHLGLGLSYVWHVANVFGGTLEARSTPNTGSSFRVTLPHTPNC